MHGDCTRDFLVLSAFLYVITDIFRLQACEFQAKQNGAQTSPGEEQERPGPFQRPAPSASQHSAAALGLQAGAYHARLQHKTGSSISSGFRSFSFPSSFRIMPEGMPYRKPQAAPAPECARRGCAEQTLNSSQSAKKCPPRTCCREHRA